MYESTYGYVKAETSAYRQTENLETFYNSPEKFYDSSKNFNGWEHFAKNHLAFDLGFDNRINKTEVISSIIEKIDLEYDLILIS